MVQPDVPNGGDGHQSSLGGTDKLLKWGLGVAEASLTAEVGLSGTIAGVSGTIARVSGHHTGGGVTTAANFKARATRLVGDQVPQGSLVPPRNALKFAHSPGETASVMHDMVHDIDLVIRAALHNGHAITQAMLEPRDYEFLAFSKARTEFLGFSKCKATYDRIPASWLLDTMQDEWMSSNGSGGDEGGAAADSTAAAEWEYAVESIAVEGNDGRDKGHAGLKLLDFTAMPEAVAAALTPAEVAALRLYTGPGYTFINQYRRELTFFKDAMDAEAWLFEVGAARFPATCFCLDRAIAKLTPTDGPDVTLYRGLRGVLPAQFGTQPHREVELAYTSTTTDKDVTTEFLGKDAAATLFAIKASPNQVQDKRGTCITIGAKVGWVSQFPAEDEVLFPSGTIMEVVQERRGDESSDVDNGGGGSTFGGHSAASSGNIDADVVGNPVGTPSSPTTLTVVSLRLKVVQAAFVPLTVVDPELYQDLHITDMVMTDVACKSMLATDTINGDLCSWCSDFIPHNDPSLTLNRGGVCSKCQPS